MLNSAPNAAQIAFESFVDCSPFIITFIHCGEFRASSLYQGWSHSRSWKLHSTTTTTMSVSTTSVTCSHWAACGAVVGVKDPQGWEWGWGQVLPFTSPTQINSATPGIWTSDPSVKSLLLSPSDPHCPLLTSSLLKWQRQISGSTFGQLLKHLHVFGYWERKRVSA